MVMKNLTRTLLTRINMDNSKYDHLETENKIYNYWEKNELFGKRKFK